MYASGLVYLECMSLVALFLRVLPYSYMVFFDFTLYFLSSRVQTDRQGSHKKVCDNVSSSAVTEHCSSKVAKGVLGGEICQMNSHIFLEFFIMFGHNSSPKNTGTGFELALLPAKKINL